MKIALFSFFFLHFSFIKAEYVLDTDGDRIPKGNLYYIRTGDPIGSGYLTLLNVGKESCPLPEVDAVLSPEGPIPLPAKFWSNWLYLFTLTDTALNFAFPPGVPLCDENSKLYVTNNLLPVGYAVSFGDTEGIPHVKGYFKIKNSGDDYKIVFCPEESPENCGDLTTYFYRGYRRLVVKYEMMIL